MYSDNGQVLTPQ